MGATRMLRINEGADAVKRVENHWIEMVHTHRVRIKMKSSPKTKSLYVRLMALGTTLVSKCFNARSR